MRTAKLILTVVATVGLFFIDSCRKTAKETSVLDEVAKPSNIGEAGTAATPIQVYGAWHAGNDYCIWGSVRTIQEFDSKNHWLIDRGDGTSLPSVNVVVLSFVHPLKLLNQTTDATTLNGVPRGMTQDIVDYFKNKGVR